MAITPAQKRWRLTPRGKYADHRWHARARGVAFTLTFEDWWALWEQSGHWKDRGSRLGCYVMSRYNDEGPYAKGNVFIAPWQANNAARNSSVARSGGTRAREIEYDDPYFGHVTAIVNALEAPF